jgi:hypothetical protein
MTQRLMDYSYLDVDKSAAGGLGIRTYFGAYVLPRIEEFLLSLPAPCEVVKLPWGGIRVDLTPSPWSAEAGALRSSWRGAMEHLKRAEFFADLRIDHIGAVHWTRPKNGDPGGRIRK